MRNLLVFFVCLAGIYSSYAQQRIDALEFVKNAPWDLTESEIDEKYKENSFELADSLKVSLAASSGGNLNFANKFLDEFCIGKYNGFTLYTINEETRKPDMFFTYIHPEQIANTDETELLRYMDSLLYVRLGEPDHKQDDYSDDNGKFCDEALGKRHGFDSSDYCLSDENCGVTRNSIDVFCFCC